MKVEILAYTPNPEEVIEKCGRTCYKSPEKDAQHRAQFIKGIVKAGHTAVIEHASATFRISEVSRALTHQLVRHRLFSFCQQSQRYVKENEPSYFTPEVLLQMKFNDTAEQQKLSDAKALYDNCMKTCWTTYNALVNLGLKKEDARYVLPNAAHTEICATGNFREWHNFLKLRCDVHAQLEIRQLAHAILQELYKIAPSVFADIYENVSQDLAFSNMIEHTNELLKSMNSELTDSQVSAINTSIMSNTNDSICNILDNNRLSQDTIQHCKQRYAEILNEQRILTEQHIKNINTMLSCNNEKS